MQCPLNPMQWLHMKEHFIQSYTYMCSGNVRHGIISFFIHPADILLQPPSLALLTLIVMVSTSPTSHDCAVCCYSASAVSFIQKYTTQGSKDKIYLVELENQNQDNLFLFLSQDCISGKLRILYVRYILIIKCRLPICINNLIVA